MNIEQGTPLELTATWGSLLLTGQAPISDFRSEKAAQLRWRINSLRLRINAGFASRSIAALRRRVKVAKGDRKGRSYKRP